MKKLLLILLCLPLIFSCGENEKVKKVEKKIVKEAIKEFEEEVKEDVNIPTEYSSPLTAEEYFNKANDYADKGEYQLAIDNYTECLRINSDFATAYFNRGNMYGKELKNYKEAIVDYTIAIEIDPNYVDAYNNRGIAKANVGLPYCSDFKRACDLGENRCCEWYNKDCK